jgi:hypothetical protein
MKICFYVHKITERHIKFNLINGDCRCRMCFSILHFLRKKRWNHIKKLSKHFIKSIFFKIYDWLSSQKHDSKDIKVSDWMRLVERKETLFFYLRPSLISLYSPSTGSFRAESQPYSTGRAEMNAFPSTHKSNVKLMRRNILFAKSLKSLLLQHPRCDWKPSMSRIRVALSVTSEMQVTRARWSPHQALT